MLRSAAVAGAGSADAATNANAAVLAHSEVFIPNLNSTRSALAVRHRRAPAGGPSTRDARVQISVDCGASATEFHNAEGREYPPWLWGCRIRAAKLAQLGTLACAGRPTMTR